MGIWAKKELLLPLFCVTALIFPISLVAVEEAELLMTSPKAQDEQQFPEFSQKSAEETLLERRISSYQMIGDLDTAVRVAKNAVKQFPASRALQEALIRALSAKAGGELEAIYAFQKYQEQFGQDPINGDKNAEIMEVVAWSAMSKGAHSGMLMTHIVSMIGAAMTRDTQAVNVLLEAMRSQNSMIRSVAIELSVYLQDVKLQDEIRRLFNEENVWQVRLEVIRAFGSMYMLDRKEALQDIVANEHSTIEEKWAAIGALIHMLEKVSHEDVVALATSHRAGLRQLACEIIAQFDLHNEIELVAPLLSDSRADVRLTALNTLGLLRVQQLKGQPIAEIIKPALNDSQPAVAITAAWLCTLSSPEEGQAVLSRWINDETPETRRLAAAALASTGKYGLQLSRKMLREHQDPFVRANIALGLIGQRVDTLLAAQTIHTLCQNDHSKWMWAAEDNSLFRVLGPSRLRHQDHIPNYPEVVNQMTRLELMSILAVIEYPGAQEAVKQFLKERSWGITGIAAVTLLEEGDEVALDIVRALLKDDDPKVRVQAALGLALWGKDPSAATVLEQAYPEADRELKIKILDALGRIGSRESIPFLLDILQEPFPTLRILAASALVQCLNH